MSDFNNFLSAAYQKVVKMKKAEEIKDDELSAYRQQFGPKMAALEKLYDENFAGFFKALESLPEKDGKKFIVKASPSTRQNSSLPNIYITLQYDYPGKDEADATDPEWRRFSCTLWSDSSATINTDHWDPDGVHGDRIEVHGLKSRHIRKIQKQIGTFVASVAPDRLAELEKALERPPPPSARPAFDINKP